MRSARPGLSLVLAGPHHPRRTAPFGGMPGVTLVGRVADELVPGLVAGAGAAVVPSLYEGFGLPALEAMAADVPVVAARTSALPEVVGDGGVLVDPTPEGLAEGLVFATSGDPDVAALVSRGRLRAEIFTWERAAAAHAAVWRNVAGQTTPTG